jgi:hypothetical protein
MKSQTLLALGALVLVVFILMFRVSGYTDTAKGAVKEAALGNFSTIQGKRITGTDVDTSDEFISDANSVKRYIAKCSGNPACMAVTVDKSKNRVYYKDSLQSAVDGNFMSYLKQA